MLRSIPFSLLAGFFNALAMPLNGLTGINTKRSKLICHESTLTHRSKKIKHSLL
jgi:hypothetical protein